MKRFTITTQQNQLLSLLYIGVPSGDIPDQLQQLLITLVVATPLVLLFSSVGGYWLAERATRPVQTITRTAQAISETDLHRRLNLRQRDEMGELAATFDRMLDRLEGAFERQQQFTADANHELRTPLSIVRIEAERVLHRPHTSQEYVQALSIISQENQLMTRLVSDLLILARADQEQTVLKYERVDLSEIIVDAAEDLSHLAAQNAIEIRLSGLDDLVVWGDRLYLTQLCINLLENAIKYSAGVGKHIEVKLDHQQGHARLQIIDEGPGIEASHLTHLFERFYRVDQSRTHTLPTAQYTIGPNIRKRYEGSCYSMNVPASLLTIREKDDAFFASVGAKKGQKHQTPPWHNHPVASRMRFIYPECTRVHGIVNVCMVYLTSHSPFASLQRAYQLHSGNVWGHVYE